MNNAHPVEVISKYPNNVTPANAGVQNPLKELDSGFRRNDIGPQKQAFEIGSIDNLKE